VRVEAWVEAGELGGGDGGAGGGGGYPPSSKYLGLI